MAILCIMLYSAAMESNSLYCAWVMPDNKDHKTEKVHKGKTGNAGRKNGGEKERQKWNLLL